MKIGKGMRPFVVSGKWKSGFITPYNEIIVSGYIEEHERLLEENLRKHAKELGIRNARELHVIMQKVILSHPRTLGYFRLQKERGILHVDTVDTKLDYIINTISNFIPFYKYIRRAEFEIFTVKGKYIRSGYVPIKEEEEGFSLLSNSQ